MKERSQQHPCLLEHGLLYGKGNQKQGEIRQGETRRKTSLHIVLSGIGRRAIISSHNITITRLVALGASTWSIIIVHTPQPSTLSIVGLYAVRLRLSLPGLLRP